MQIRSLVAAALLLAATGGCLHVRYLPMNPAPRPTAPRPAASVEMHTARPARPYVETGLIEIEQADGDPAKLHAKLRQTGGDHGCDGLVLLSSTDRVEGGVQIGIFNNTTTVRGYRASCIVYEQPRAAAGLPEVRAE